MKSSLIIVIPKEKYSTYNIKLNLLIKNEYIENYLIHYTYFFMDFLTNRNLNFLLKAIILQIIIWIYKINKI